MRKYIRLKETVIDYLMSNRWNSVVYEMLHKTINEARKDARKTERKRTRKLIRFTHSIR